MYLKGSFLCICPAFSLLSLLFKMQVRNRWLLPDKLAAFFSQKNIPSFMRGEQTDLHLYFQSNFPPFPNVNVVFPFYPSLIVPWKRMLFSCTCAARTVFPLLKCLSLYFCLTYIRLNVSSINLIYKAYPALTSHTLIMALFILHHNHWVI